MSYNPVQAVYDRIGLEIVIVLFLTVG